MKIDPQIEDDLVVCFKRVAGVVLVEMLQMIAEKDVARFRRGISDAAMGLAAAFAHEDGDPQAFLEKAQRAILQADSFGAPMQ